MNIEIKEVKPIYNYKEHKQEVTELFEKIEAYLTEKYFTPSTALDKNSNELLKWTSLFGAFKGLIEGQCYNNRELFKMLKKELEYLHL